MPTLLDEPELTALADPLLDEAPVEEFDLENLARISDAPPAIEPPRFALLEPEPRFRLRRMAVTGFLAALVVVTLGTLRPAVQGTYVTSGATQTGASSVDSAVCPVD